MSFVLPEHAYVSIFTQHAAKLAAVRAAKHSLVWGLGRYVSASSALSHALWNLHQPDLQSPGGCCRWLFRLFK